MEKFVCIFSEREVFLHLCFGAILSVVLHLTLLLKFAMLFHVSHEKQKREAKPCCNDIEGEVFQEEKREGELIGLGEGKLFKLLKIDKNWKVPRQIRRKFVGFWRKT
jgi:hypothetical protein